MFGATGPTFPKSIPCFTCQKTKLEYIQFTPMSSDEGEPLDVGSSMENSPPIKNRRGAKFFQLVPASNETGLISPQEFRLQNGGRWYHDYRYLEPDFGERLGQIVFICERCVAHYETRDALEIRIARIAQLGLHARYGVILDACFYDDLFSLEPSLMRQSVQRIKPRTRRRLHYLLPPFLAELSQLENRAPIKRIGRKLRHIEKMLPPRKQTARA